MLDSTGINSWVDVSCIFCPKAIRLETYTPKVGHGGQDLVGLGNYLQTSRAHLDGAGGESIFCAGAIYKILYDGELFKVEVFHPRYDGNSYSYNNPIEPEFGFGPEKAFWICGNCLEILCGDCLNILKEEIYAGKILETMRKKVTLFTQLEAWAGSCKRGTEIFNLLSCVG